MWFCVFEVDGIFVHVSEMVGIIIFYQHTQSHTVTLASSFFLRLLSSSALSILSTLNQDPVTDPPKRDWLQEKKRILFAFSFLCLSLSLGSLLFSSVFITLPFIPPRPCLYFLLWVKFKNVPLWVFHPQIPSCCYLLWSTLKARGSTKVQIRFFWILLLWIENCPCYLSP